MGDEEVMKDVVLEVGYMGEGDAVVAYPFCRQHQSQPFSVAKDDEGKLSAVLREPAVIWIAPPPPRQSLVFRVIKLHKIQKDALIGEAALRDKGGGRKRMQL